MYRKITVCLVSLAVCCVSLTAFGQEKFSLQTRFPEGKYVGVIDITMDMQQEIMGNKLPMKQVQQQHFDIIAAAIEPDGSQKVTMVLTRMVMKMNSPMVNMEFDSADTDEKANANPALKVLAKMIGMTITTIYDKEGKVAKIEGIEEFFDKLAKEADPMSKQIFDGLKKQMGEGSFTKTFDASRDVMPSGPVAVGDTWKSDTMAKELPMIGNMNIEATSTLKSVKKDAAGTEIAEIISVTDMTNSDAQDMTIGPITMRISKMTMQVETTFCVETKTGLVVSSNGVIKKMDIEMSMIPPVGNDAANNTAIPAIKMSMSMTGETKMTVTRKESK